MLKNIHTYTKKATGKNINVTNLFYLTYYINILLNR